jgi:S-adenosylmethionine-diacylglycerol 3-amino-3-carboxypropyl transferase
LLELIGSRPSKRREQFYLRCRPALSSSARAFWDGHAKDIACGIGSAGKFERYFALFRQRVLPLVHSRDDIARLFRGGTPSECAAYYDRCWDNWRWRLLFCVFFSRFLMGRLGRDPSFFTYVEGTIADRLLARTRHAVTALNPADNPYLHWILTGRHGAALPLALRPENFEAIRANIDRVELHCMSLEDFLKTRREQSVDCFNLSDIFEYMSPENTRALLELIVCCGRAGARLAYWNTLVPRSRPDSLADVLRPLPELAEYLHHGDKAFFYTRFVVEEID